MTSITAGLYSKLHLIVFPSMYAEYEKDHAAKHRGLTEIL